MVKMFAYLNFGKYTVGLLFLWKRKEYASLMQGFPNWGTFRLLKGYIIMRENILI